MPASGVTPGSLAARLAARLLLSSGRAIAREILRRQAAANVARPSASAAALREPGLGRRLLGFSVYSGWLLAWFASLVALFNVELDLFFGHGLWQSTLKLAAGAILSLEGLLLATNWQGARGLLRARRLARRKGRLGGVWRSRAFGTLLYLIGLVWLAAGAFELARGAALFR